MDPEFYSLLAIIIVNVIFLILGVFLNSLAIMVLCLKTQLRRKLSYFMIMVLSCCDLLTIVVNHPLFAIISAYLMRKEFEVQHWVTITLEATSYFHLTSVLSLLVMNIDRYVAIFHPFYHKTKVTKGRVLSLLGIMTMVNFVLLTLSIDKLVYSIQTYSVFFIVFFMSPMLFINYKLFKFLRKARKTNALEHGKKTNSLRHTSNNLLAFACSLFLYIPSIVAGLYAVSFPDSKVTIEKFLTLWLKTIVTMNSTFNCLIFYWKNKLLRREGIRFILAKWIT